jgi:hypothetical protein
VTTTRGNLGKTPHAGEANRWRTYLAVALVELVVVLALWAFGRYFGSL